LDQTYRAPQARENERRFYPRIAHRKRVTYFRQTVLGIKLASSPYLVCPQA
jgi:hypothetical protein